MARATFLDLLCLASLVAVALQGCGGGSTPTPAPAPAQLDWVCSTCKYVYVPADYDNAAFEDLPDDWKCPVCSQPKSQFQQQSPTPAPAPPTPAPVLDWVCSTCNYVYVPADYNDTAFEDLP